MIIVQSLLNSSSENKSTIIGLLDSYIKKLLAPFHYVISLVMNIKNMNILKYFGIGSLGSFLNKLGPIGTIVKVCGTLTKCFAQLNSSI